MAWLYLIHFDEPYQHARHYLGWTGGDVEDRFVQHVSGTGSALVRAACNAGINVRIVWTKRVALRGGRDIERRMKNNGSSARICPECAAATRRQRSATARARRRRRQPANAGAGGTHPDSV